MRHWVPHPYFTTTLAETPASNSVDSPQIKITGATRPRPPRRRCIQTSNTLRRRDSEWGLSAPRDDTARERSENGAKSDFLPINVTPTPLVNPENRCEPRIVLAQARKSEVASAALGLPNGGVRLLARLRFVDFQVFGLGFVGDPEKPAVRAPP
jgi:hypothetical protein